MDAHADMAKDICGTMKICLINPPYSLQDRYGPNIPKDIDYTLPPLGLAYLGAVVEKAGHEVVIIDAPAYSDYDHKKLIEIVNGESFDLFGITSITPTFPSALKLITMLKNKFPDTPTVLGGAHASGFPVKLLEENIDIDYICYGEGEITFPELIKSIEGKMPIEDVLGISYRKQANIILNESRLYIDDLDVIPFPARHLLPHNTKYIPLPNHYRRLPVMHMINSRGCSYGKCTFCFEAGRLGARHRLRTPENTIEEINELVKDHDVKEISFWDDNFLANHNWVRKFSKLMIKENPDIIWSCSTRVDFVTEEILKTIKEAGCWSIFFGIESGNQDLLDFIKKGITLEQSRKAVKLCKKIGIETRASYMLALPKETPEKAEKTIGFAIELDTDFAQFCITSPYPGTVLYDQVRGLGKLLPNLEDYNSSTPVFIPNGYDSTEQIKKIQVRAYRRFYMRPKFIWGKLEGIKSLRDIKRYLVGFKFLLGITE